MGDKIQVTEAQNAQLTSSMEKIKASLDDIIICLNQLSNACNSLKGEAAEQLKKTITTQKNSFQKELNQWDTVISQAKKIHDEIQKVDKELAQK